jgi:hypothetical protein
MPLRPLIVLTGSIHVEGGDTHKVRQADTQHGNITINHTRKITPDRRKANVVSTGYMRRVDRLRVLKTPYGNIVDPEKLPAIKELLTCATRDVATFNAAHSTARLTNCLLWEHLRGQRLAAVEGWIMRGLSDKVPEVVEAASALLAT